MVSNLDAIIFAAYLVILAIIGFVTARWIKTGEEYIVADRRLKLWFSILNGCSYLDWRWYNHRCCREGICR